MFIFVIFPEKRDTRVRKLAALHYMRSKIIKNDYQVKIIQV